MLAGLLIAISLLVQSCLGSTYYYTNNNHNVIGKIQTVQAKQNDTISSLARRYDVGFDELIAANNNINPYMILPGTVIIIPTRFILPKIKHQGIVVNLAEKRMYYFNKNKVLSFPIGIGKIGWATPVGTMRIISKMHKPTWNVPEAVRQEQIAHGNFLPKTVPPGPNNPLGNHALRLSKSNYLIHGTNQPDGVGKRVSAGCLRMYPEDIRQLYNLVPVKTKITIINQPLKHSFNHGDLLIESHPPLIEAIDDKNIEDGADMSTPRTLAEAINYTFELIDDYNLEPITADTVRLVLNSSNGIPQLVAKKPL